MKKVILLFTLSISLSSFAQTNLDSLWSTWENQHLEDSTRLKAIHQIAWDHYLFSNPDSAFYIADLQYEFAKTAGLKKQMALALNTQGLSFTIRGDFLKGLTYIKKSLKLREEVGDKKGIAGSLINIGSTYLSLGNYPRALNYYQKGLRICEEIGEIQFKVNALGNIGDIYYAQKDYGAAMEYYEQCLSLVQDSGNKYGIAALMIRSGRNFFDQGDHSRALEYYNQGLEVFEEMGHKIGMAEALGSIGSVYDKLGEHAIAMDYFQRMKTISEELGDVKGISAAYVAMGKALSAQGEYSKAIPICQKGLLYGRESGNLEIQKRGYKCLYDSYKALGDGSKALEFHEQMISIEDSLNKEETSKKLQQMEYQKEMLADSIATAEETRLIQEAHEEEVRKKNKTKNMAIGAGLLFLLLAGGFYSRWKYVRKSRDIISKEKDRSENLLLNILPAEIAEELKEKGEAAARDFDMVSILFTDFKEFTQVSEQLSAAELVEEINACFKAFDKIVEKHGIEKIKTIGDAYMAAGGLPVPTDNSVENTILAALEMQNFISSRKTKLDLEGKPGFEMRVGVHTGPVVAGIVGVKKFQYDIWGDTVNTASRIESNGEAGKVNISQSTYELIKDDPSFSFESRGKIEAKGKGEMDMWFVSKA